jgi:FkbM family methyltransferase
MSRIKERVIAVWATGGLPMIEHFLHFVRMTGRVYPEPMTILDLGCCTGDQSVELAKAFPKATIHAFECNPDVLPLAADTLRQASLGQRLHLHAYAVDVRTGERDFWKSDPEVNKGAGSFLVSTGHEALQPLRQQLIQVPSIRLDEWAAAAGIARFDLVWADLQGAELGAFLGMGEMLITVELAHVEVAFRELYRGQPLIDDVRRYFMTFGLRLWAVIHDRSGYFGDAIFVRDR